MLARLTMRLKSDGALNLQMASLFQGALMEMLPSEYAESLHISQLHPYTQYLYREKEVFYWVVNCLNKEACHLIIEQCLNHCDQIEIKKHDLHVQLLDKELKIITYEELSQLFYQEDSNRYFHLQFLTPTAFKQLGSYVFFPDIRLIYRSLMTKYDAAVQAETMFDEDTLEQLADSSEITAYRLKSVNFHLEGVRINSFVGELTIRIHGPQTMVNFANMLFEFGYFSGVGIKTGIGMGAMQLERRAPKNEG